MSKASNPGSRPRLSPVQIPDSAATRGYIAGVFDSEGCLYHRGKYGSGWTAKITNSNPELMVWLENMLGRRASWRLQSSPPNHPIAHLAIYHQRDLRVFLGAVYPYLIVKRALAERVLQLL